MKLATRLVVITIIAPCLIMGCSKPTTPSKADDFGYSTVPSGTMPVTPPDPAFEKPARRQIRFVGVPGGMHSIGDDVSGPWHDGSSERRRLVMTDRIAISVTEITEEVYWAVIDPARTVPSDRADFPITGVSYHDARRFCQLLSMRTGITIRLPTEFEWEVACAVKPRELFGVWRGETSQEAAIQAFLISDKGKLERGAAASFRFNATGPWPVGKSTPNSLGIFDLHGNCWEWTQRDPRDDVRNHEGMQAIRGGAFSSTSPLDCRRGHRAWEREDSTKSSIGFRIVCEQIDSAFVIPL